MYLPIDSKETCVKAWLDAATSVETLGGEAHNVIVDIAEPLKETATDAAVAQVVDAFLRQSHANSLIGVANTIFPQSILTRHGPDDFYDVYHNTVLPRMKTMTRDWGRYFERLTSWKKLHRTRVQQINPLEELICFMRDQIASKRTYRNVYEMTIYDPTRDAGKVANRQCLSFLSFKLTQQNTLSLTVMYRNHAYIGRGLGNFIGLGRLMNFVATKTGAKVGSLTCISTHAFIDHGKVKHDNVTMGWTQREARALLEHCRSINGSR